MQRIEENKIGSRKAELIREVSWSELCSDLLGDIMGRLCRTDQARFRAVCKSWRHVSPINKSHAVFKPEWLEGASILSWFVLVDHRFQQDNIGTLEFCLHEPCHSYHDPISVQTISLSELGIPILPYPDIKIFCKNNWLFISITNYKKVGRAVQIYFLLFSPLTKTLRQLPPCLHSSLRYFELSFSSDPESADCVFLLLDTWSFDAKFIVSTYCKDDKEWTLRPFTKVHNFEKGMCRTIYTGGKFYIVSPRGQVASYNVITKKINYESLLIDDDLAENYVYPGYYDLFVVKGELMYIIYCHTASVTKRFDRLNKVWIPARSFQDSAIFDSGSLIFFSESESSDLVDLVPSSPGFIFRLEGWSVSDSFFSFLWLKPPLLQ